MKTQQPVQNKTWSDIALPLVLMLTGLVLTGGDWLGMLSLDRIQNLWPVAIILIGLLELMTYSEHGSL